MLTSLELEIRHLLSEGLSLPQVVEEIVQTVENEGDEITQDHVLTLCRFLLSARAYSSLIQFVLKHLKDKDFPIPWPYFLQALEPWMTPAIAQVLLKGIKELKQGTEASRVAVLDAYSEELPEIRSRAPKRAKQKAEAQKVDGLRQLEILRVQQLFDQERALLQKLIRVFPGEAEIMNESVDFKDRNALEVIARHSPLRRTQIIEDSPDPETEKVQSAWSETLTQAALSHPGLEYDFALAAFMMGLFECSLKILDLTPPEEKNLWFRLEVLLETRRFLDLLQTLGQVEVLFAQNPETFFATAYYRAQAFWGLGQKHMAIEIMEAVLTAQPNYRMGPALLSMWRNR